jgi:hypothetical protein
MNFYFLALVTCPSYARSKLYKTNIVLSTTPGFLVTTAGRENETNDIFSSIPEMALILNKNNPSRNKGMFRFVRYAVIR